ncbi:MAG TPA: alpha/beta hydrolase [Pseudonocardia sp.]|nr:alpha/beta hydrolase [Pseudonocardia sp.]
MRVRSRFAVPAAVLTVLCAVAACSPSTAGAPTAAPGPVPPGLERFYAQELSWGPCDEFATTPNDVRAFADPQLECTRLEVPLDYADPGGSTAEIAVMRRGALDPQARIGSLLTNPGGPGASGLSGLASVVVPGAGSGPLAQRFDLVGFDPRGVAASTPEIDCLTDVERDAERADVDVDPSPAGVAETEAENQRYADRCSERVGDEVLATVGTRDASRDMDVLRAALGDAELTYLGYSYGTQLGTAYAEQFPDNVRAMVLDGAVDPTQSPAERLVAQGAGFQQAFQAFADWCVSQPEPCPLGQDAAGATAAYQALTRPLIDRPVPAGERELSYTDAITGTVQALYLSAAWPVLREGLSDVAQGSGEVLLALADLYEDRSADGRYSDSLEAFVAILCVDQTRVTDRAEAGEIQRRYLEASPFQDPGRGVVAALDTCALWPVPPTSEPAEADVSVPAMVVSVTGDPATPYQAGVDLAQALDATLLTVEGNQHTAALQGNACVDGAVTAYLTELREPSADARCTL